MEDHQPSWRKLPGRHGCRTKTPPPQTSATVASICWAAWALASGQLPWGQRSSFPLVRTGVEVGQLSGKAHPAWGKEDAPAPGDRQLDPGPAPPLPTATSPVQCRITTFSLNIFLPPPRSLRNPTIVFTISFFFLFFLFFFIF